MMYKVIGNRLIKEEIVKTPKQTAVVRSDIEVVENPNDETLEIGVIPEKPQETDRHYVVMTLNNGVLAYELRVRSKPVKDKVNELEYRTLEAENAILTLMDLTLMGGM